MLLVVRGSGGEGEEQGRKVLGDEKVSDEEKERTTGKEERRRQSEKQSSLFILRFKLHVPSACAVLRAVFFERKGGKERLGARKRLRRIEAFLRLGEAFPPPTERLVRGKKDCSREDESKRVEKGSRERSSRLRGGRPVGQQLTEGEGRPAHLLSPARRRCVEFSGSC